jgi:hypothetical protein
MLIVEISQSTYPLDFAEFKTLIDVHSVSCANRATFFCGIPFSRIVSRIGEESHFQETSRMFRDLRVPCIDYRHQVTTTTPHSLSSFS